MRFSIRHACSAVVQRASSSVPSWDRFMWRLIFLSAGDYFDDDEYRYRTIIIGTGCNDEGVVVFVFVNVNVVVTAVLVMWWWWWW
jgi:hypothetical protein